MYLLLLVFGAVSTATGIVLAASGVSLHDHIFDPSVGTAGVIGAVGGLLLIGLGLTLRALQRIELALAARTAPQVVQPGAALTIAPAPPAAARVRLAPKVTATPATEEKPAENTPAVGLETEMTQAAEETPTPSPKLTSIDAPGPEVDKGPLARRRNGFASTRIAPRLDMSARGGTLAERPAGPAFDTLWPKGPRPSRPVQSAPLQPPAPAQPSAPASAPAAEQKTGTAVETPEPVAAADDGAVTVLKSGVVDGMAYTLFSDGSIEAQLPQGTLRFGSITELRNHIEQSA